MDKLSPFQIRGFTENKISSLSLFISFLKQILRGVHMSTVSTTVVTESDEYRIFGARPKLVVGGNAFGTSLDVEDVTRITNRLLQKFDVSPVEIDTALVYGNGKSESILSSFNSSSNILISTKLTASGGHNLGRESIRNQMHISLKRLNRNEVDILYIHQPSCAVPILETLVAINGLYRQRKFKRFGICHYSAWEVAEIVYLCDKHNLVRPSVYQVIRSLSPFFGSTKYQIIEQKDVML